MMTKMNPLYLALVFLSLGTAWGFVASPLTSKVTTKTQLDMYTTYGDRSSWDGAYTLGSSFLQGNMVNDPYAFERRYDRNNKDDVRIDPWGYWRDGSYYGRSSLGRRLSPYYNENYNGNYYNMGYGNDYYNGYNGYGGYYNNGYYNNGYYNNGYGGGYGYNRYNRYNPYYDNGGYYGGRRYNRYY